MEEILKLKKGYLVGCRDRDDALAKTQVAAFLCKGGEESDFAVIHVGSDGVDEKGRPQKKKRKIPLHNLSRLLGEGKLAELVKKFPDDTFAMDLVAIKNKKKTTELQMKLWRLQGYLAEYRPFLDEMGIRDKRRQRKMAGSVSSKGKMDERWQSSKDQKLLTFGIK